MVNKNEFPTRAEINEADRKRVAEQNKGDVEFKKMTDKIDREFPGKNESKARFK